MHQNKAQLERIYCIVSLIILTIYYYECVASFIIVCKHTIVQLLHRQLRNYLLKQQIETDSNRQ